MNKKFILVFVIIILIIGIVNAVPLEISETKVEPNDKVSINLQEREFKFQEGGKLTVSYNGNNYEYSSLSKVEFSEGGTSITKEPQIIFSADGRIKEAYFTTGRDDVYLLGNEIVALPSGSKVVYKDGKAMIQIPGETFTSPKPVNQNEKGSSSFIYFSNNQNGIKYGEYYIKGGLGYENGNYFIQNQKMIELGDIVISNPANIKTYLDFYGKVNFAYEGAYISMDKQNGVLVTGSNIAQQSPAIMIKKDNAYGVIFDSEKDHFAFQSSGNTESAYFKIKKSSQGLVPEIEHLNDFVMNQDDKSFFYDSKTGNLYDYPNGRLIKDFGEAQGSSTVAMTLTGSFKTSPGKIESVLGNSVLGISNFNEYAVGVDKMALRLKSYPKNPKFYTLVSASEAYNYALTEEGFERATGIRLIAADSSGRSYLADSNNIRYLYDLLGSIPMKQAKMIDEMYFHRHSPYGYAYASYSGNHMEIHMTVGGRITGSGNRLSAGTWRHEMGHIVDFSGGRNNKFDRMWYNSGIDSKVIVSDYAENGGERISEFIGDLAFASDNGIKEILRPSCGSNWQNNKWCRAAFAVAWYNHGFTYDRVAEIFSGVGLPYDENSLYGYMREVGIRI